MIVGQQLDGNVENLRMLQTSLRLSLSCIANNIFEKKKLPTSGQTF